jgi:hypothetical protein
MDAFYDLCHAAGPKACAFYAHSPEAIRIRLDNILESLRIHPIVVPAASNTLDFTEVIYYSSLKRLISTTLYQPLMFFPSFAQVLSFLEDGDGRPFLDFVTAQGVRKPFSCDCPTCGVPMDVPDDSEDLDDTFRSVMCSDGGPMNDTVEEFQKYASALQNQSKAAGAVQTVFRMSCVGWKIEAKWRFAGMFSKIHKF